MQRRMLSREDEGQGDSNEVRREDQDRINKFSRLHQQSQTLKSELEAKQKEKEELEDVSNELELKAMEADDEDEQVPYKLGDSFFSLPVSEVQELLSSSTAKIDEEVGALEERLSSTTEEMDQLKAQLYARFGKSINLET